MAVIEQAMTDSAGEYWKSTEMQTEYLAILEAEDAKDVSEAGDVSPVDWANMPADVIGNEIIEATGVTEAEVAELVEWTGTDPASVAEGFAHARAFWDGMAELAGPDGYQAIYEAYTTELPTEVMRGVDCELCMDAPYYEPAGAGEVTRFNQTSAGALASQQWGSQSEARLGVLTARWARMTDGLSDPDFKALDGFIRNRLSPRERAWVWTALAT